jgi:hypothetical protein
MKKNSELHIQFLLWFISERNNGIVTFVGPQVCNSITADSGTMIMMVPVLNITFIYNIPLHQ